MESFRLHSIFLALSIPDRILSDVPLPCIRALQSRSSFESGVDTPGGGTLYKNGSDLSYQSLGLTLPVVVKPCSGGSSIGVYIVNTDEEYQNAPEAFFPL